MYLCGFASQFATQFEPNANQKSNWFATLRIKNKGKHTIKKGEFTWISPKETTDLTIYLNINDPRPFSRTTATFKMLSIVMWYLIRAAVKNVRINLGQLRNKRQIDSQLGDSICAAYVLACSHQPQALAATENCFKFLMLQKFLLHMPKTLKRRHVSEKLRHWSGIVHLVCTFF